MAQETSIHLHDDSVQNGRDVFAVLAAHFDKHGDTGRAELSGPVGQALVAFVRDAIKGVAEAPEAGDDLVDRAAFAIACTMAEQDGVLLTSDGYKHGAVLRSEEHKRFLIAIRKGVEVVLKYRTM